MHDDDSSHSKSWLERLSHMLQREPHDQEDLLEILQGAHEHNILDETALRMMEGVLEVSGMQVRDIMIPRSQMVIIEKNEELDDFLPRVIESGHSRFPVVGEDKDDITGLLLAKDLLRYAGKNSPKLDLKDVVRPAVFVPESKRLNVLLNEFRINRNHMALVIDEYGCVAGLITIEDVLEEIVGDIVDEHDIETDETNIKPKTHNEYAIKALTPIEEFNDYFDTEINDEEFDTIGGLVTHWFGYLPKRGESVTIENFHFTVLRADKRRIRTLIVSRHTKSRDIRRSALG